MSAPGTLRAAFEAARTRLRAAGLDEADLDARVLTTAAAGLAPLDLIPRGADPMTADAAARLGAFLERRLAGEPVARLLGRREFWGLDLELGPTTLVPRPDTETLVEAVLDHLRHAGGVDKPWRIADLGTGTGAILAALVTECPNAFGIGIERDPAAARIAAGNVERLGLAVRAAVVVGDWADALHAETFDVVVSNPPYIATDEIATLDVEVRAHDPLPALDGGPDGLDAYRALLPSARRCLRPGGLLALEIGETQASEVSELVAAAGFLAAGTVRRDLAGRPRVVVGLAL